MKTQNKKNQNIKRVNNKNDNSKCNMFAIGYLDLTFVINFNDKDLIQTNDGKTTHNDIKEINSIEQIDFIKDNKDLINNIELKSENDSLKQFLLISKTSKGNRQIEFFTFLSPKFEGKSQFFETIFKQVMKKYGILINPYPLDKNQSYSLKIELIHKNNLNFFYYKEMKDKESDNTFLSESPVNGSPNGKEDNYDEDGNYEEENEYVKNGLIPKFKRKGCMLSKLKPSCQKYDLIYININDFKNIEGDFEENDLIELLKFFKSKKSKIFVNYFKPEKSDLAEPPEEEEDEMEDDDTANNLTNNDNYNNEQNENNEEQNDNKENNESDEGKEEEKQKTKNFSKQKIINIIYNLSDIYFFDEKQAYDLFNKHLKYYSKDKSNNKLNKAKIYDYFISSIAGKTKNSENKIGLFLNELEKFTIVTCSKNSGTKETLDSKLYPQKNARNIDMINQYKSLIQENKDELYNTFCSLMLGSISSGNKDLIEEINIGFKNALNIIKKEIECKKNKIEFSWSKLVDCKTIEIANKQSRENYSQKWKEKGFVLDCMNVEKSKLKDYAPLKDKNLKFYFRSKSNMKYLVQRGLVDKDGYILYDKEYRKVYGSPNRLRENKARNNRSLSKIILELSLNNNNGLNKNYIITENIRTKEKVPK